MFAQLRAFANRVLGLFRSRDLESRIDEELRCHLEMQTEENRRNGMEPGEARVAALCSLGGIDQVKEKHRDVRAFRLVSDFLQDLRFGARMLRRKPKFAFAAILTLALAIGPNTALFSIIKGVQNRYLPFPDSDRLVQFTTINPKLSMVMQNASYPDFQDYVRLNHTLESAAYFHYTSANVAGPAGTERVWAARTTASLFDMLKRSPKIGRVFTENEYKPGADPVAVISTGLWKRMFSRDPSVLGKAVSINHIHHTIIGVMPDDFEFPETQYELWLPLEASVAQLPRDYRSGYILARLKSGVSLDSAQQDISQIAAMLAREYPDKDSGYSVMLEDYSKIDLPESGKRIIPAFYLAVDFVLLIACANISTLLLAKATGRSREMAIRSSIGGPKNRLLRQLLTESLLIGALGGILGILAAFVWLKGILAIVPSDMPNRVRIGIDCPSLVYTAGIAFLSSLIFGLLPALRITSRNQINVLKEESRASIGRARHRLLNVFMVMETAMAVVLLVATGMLVRSYRNEITTDPGYDRRNLLTIQLELPESLYPRPADMSAFVENSVHRFKALLETRMVAVTQMLPMAGGVFYIDTFSVQGLSLPLNQRQSASGISVSPEYFRTFRIPLLQGRHFSASDGLSHPVAIISAGIAKHYFGDTLSPIGRMIKFDKVPEKRWMEIIGVVGDVRVWRLKDDPTPQIYIPYAQQPTRLLALVARTGKDPLQYAVPAKELMHSIDPEQPGTIQTMEEIIDTHLSDTKMLSQLIGSVTAFALILATLGVYSIISYAVSERTHEIGIRIAFGAQKPAICRIILTKGVIFLAFGLCIGLAGAIALTRFLRMFLFGVTPSDPVSYFATGIVLMVAGILAMVLPARRAMSVDPMVAIRHE